jgi:uncharacterized protein (DUF58 family)
VLFDEATVRRLDRLVLRLNRRLFGRPGGERLSPRRVPSADLGDHRAYASGDDLRHIDWHTYARHDQLIVRLGETSQSIPVHVALDRSRSMAWRGRADKWHVARRLAGAIGYVALAAGDRLTLSAFDETLEPLLGPTQGKVHVAELFSRVAALAPARRTALAAVLAALRKAAPRAGLVVLISDFLSEEDAAATLAALSGPRRELLVLHLVDPLELDPGARGAVDLEDVETGERLALEIDDATLAGYRDAARVWCEGIAHAVLRHGGSYARVETDWPLERQIVPYLRRRGVLA